jgi:hypothetical protein
MRYREPFAYVAFPSFPLFIQLAHFLPIFFFDLFNAHIDALAMKTSGKRTPEPTTCGMKRKYKNHSRESFHVSHCCPTRSIELSMFFFIQKSLFSH